MQANAGVSCLSQDWSRRILSVVVVLAVAGAGLPTQAGPSWASSAPSAQAVPEAGPGGLTLLGPLDEPPVTRRNQGKILYVDAPGRTMYYGWLSNNGDQYLRAYSLRTTKPTLLWEAPLPGIDVRANITPYVTAYDARRHRLAIMVPTDQAGNQTLAFYDTRARRLTGSVSLASTVPGFVPLGLTYSAQDDRYYLAGDFSGSYYVATGTVTFGQKATGSSSIVALDGTGKFVWIRVVKECQQILYSKFIGSLIVRVRREPILSLACVTGGLASGQTLPGQSGLVRMRIDPRTASSVDATQFPVSFFPIAGNYYRNPLTGIAAYDPVSDRFFLQSISVTTPGDWVFDGRLLAWVGFISAPSTNDFFVAFNERLGNLYIGGKAATFVQGKRVTSDLPGLVVAAGRTNPVPAGRAYSIEPVAFMVADGGSNRLFVPVGDHGPQHIDVFADQSPAPVPLKPLDYDALTAGTAEKPSDFVFFAGSGNGFGVRDVQVGGTGAFRPNNVPPLPVAVAGGTRAFGASWVPSVDLSGAGASASAAAAVVDSNTAAEYSGTSGRPDYPYPPVSCLDAGSGLKPQAASGAGGTAQATCEFRRRSARGEASYGPAGNGNVGVGASKQSTWATRDFVRGVRVSSTSIVDGLRVDLGALSLSVGRVVSQATAVAHGSSRTASASWSRTVSGLALRDVTGRVVWESPGCRSDLAAGTALRDSCRAMAAQINEQLQVRARITFPVPDVLATPGGAFASVSQTLADYLQERTLNDQGVLFTLDSTGRRPVPGLQLEFFNDGTERSRQLVQMAAVQASTILTVSSTRPTSGLGAPQPAPDELTQPGSSRDTTASPRGSGSTRMPPLSNGATGVLADGSADTPSGLLQTVTGYLFLHRGVRDAVLLGLLFSLMLAGCATAWRRRQLVSVLTTVDKENL